ncbi:kinase-like domain-containing protein [Baffinella frigidus]|nr:kinase-like domain-containing protein [Cryptophyta sp. CCMP2293]
MFRAKYAYYLVMEFAEGGTLAKRVCASLSTDDARRWSLQLARVLEYIHDQSMAHRDLKPENVFLTKALDIKLGDFGLAKDLGPNSSTTMSQAMTQVGTTNYFSPELGEGLSCGAKGSVRGNDMWALGCIVIELVRRERLDASLWPPEVSGNRDKLLADALAADPLLGTATTLMLVEYHMRTYRRLWPPAFLRKCTEREEDTRLPVGHAEREQQRSCLTACLSACRLKGLLRWFEHGEMAMECRNESVPWDGPCGMSFPGAMPEVRSETSRELGGCVLAGTFLAFEGGVGARTLASLLVAGETVPFVGEIWQNLLAMKRHVHDDFHDSGMEY